MGSHERYSRDPVAWQGKRDATVGVIDSQSVTTAENGGPRGFDTSKKIRGHKRHITTDTLGHVVAAIALPANIQGLDGGYAGEKLRGALAELGRWMTEIVKRSDRTEDFVVLPKRWIVERSFAWLGRCRRLTQDVEAIISSSCAWLMIARIRKVLRKINQSTFCFNLSGSMPPAFGMSCFRLDEPDRCRPEADSITPKPPVIYALPAFRLQHPKQPRTLRNRQPSGSCHTTRHI